MNTTGLEKISLWPYHPEHSHLISEANQAVGSGQYLDRRRQANKIFYNFLKLTLGARKLLERNKIKLFQINRKTVLFYNLILNSPPFHLNKRRVKNHFWISLNILCNARQCELSLLLCYNFIGRKRKTSLCDLPYLTEKCSCSTALPSPFLSLSGCSRQQREVSQCENFQISLSSRARFSHADNTRAKNLIVLSTRSHGAS